MEEWRSREVHDKAELIFPTKDGDKRTYSYVVGFSCSSEPNWNDLIFLAKLIPRILHNINCVCYVFGGPVQYEITDITHTTLNEYVLEQLREADAIGNEIIIQAGVHRVISQMPIVLIPMYFDRDPTNRTPSCCRSIVLRPFLTNDFMTGVPVIPGSLQLPTQVVTPRRQLRRPYKVYTYI
ncbi:GMP synthase [glutamine-hydrolyzing]-like isoform X1 [Bactrocera neohumeralis]|uniref:GMP synthase [glutamine-hydrolyzing]-like isoform X1 n=1 Tax=Bactrocera neohumeralis TaxID=98809 RepID=UPI00216532A2|nr:GMP synthase [glutamine-hydrolyzing]-like isoform X1 [Bactrocera neohumeralis]